MSNNDDKDKIITDKDELEKLLRQRKPLNSNGENSDVSDNQDNRGADKYGTIMPMCYDIGSFPKYDKGDAF